MTTFTSEDHFEDSQFPFSIQLYTIEPTESISLHSHEFYELVYVKSGSAEHVMSDKTYHLQAGDVFVVEPSVVHSYQGFDNQSATVYNVLFHLDLIRKDLQALFELSAFIHLFYLAPFLRRTSYFVPYLSLTEKQAERCTQYLDLLLDEVTEKERGYQLASKTLLINTMIYLSRCCGNDTSLRQVDVTSQDVIIDAIVAFIRENYRQPLSITQMGRNFGMSTSSLLSKFKQHTGRTVFAYKHQLQIAEARRRIIVTEDKIITIAQSVGFDDLSFFYRVFRRETGMTPAQYRRAYTTE